MKTTRLFAALLTALCVSPVFAQAQAQAEPDFTFTGNAGLFSDYRFRGFSQTNLKPAIQGGFDFAHKSGFYAGNWNSNVASELYGGGNIEMDFYGGYKGKAGDFGYDVGVLYYYYPGSTAAKGGDIDNTELYVAGTYGPFTAKYSHGVSDFFGAPGTKNTHYLDLGLNFDLGSGWGANAHVGYQKLKKSVNANGQDLDHYLDYKVGVTKDLNGWLLGASVVATSEKNWYLTTKGRDAGRTGLVVRLSKAF